MVIIMVDRVQSTWPFLILEQDQMSCFLIHKSHTMLLELL